MIFAIFDLMYEILDELFVQLFHLVILWFESLQEVFVVSLRSSSLIDPLHSLAHQEWYLRNHEVSSLIRDFVVLVV